MRRERIGFLLAMNCQLPKINYNKLADQNSFHPQRGPSFNRSKAMKRNTLKWVIVVLGALLLIASLIADYVWVYSYPGYNTQQIIGIVAGAVILLLGLLLPKK